MRNRKGFTLTELLVVITIIAILGAIMYPVILRAKESSKMATCLSNCRQIGIAFLMYMQEAEDTMPMMDSAWSTTAEADNDLWGNGFTGHAKARDVTNMDYIYKASILACLQSFVKDSKIWWCPNYKMATAGALPGAPTTGVNYYWNYYPYSNRLVSNSAVRYHDDQMVPTSEWPQWVHDSWNIIRPTETLNKTNIGAFRKVYSMGDYPKPEKVMIFMEKLPLHDLKRVVNSIPYGYSLDPSCRKPFVFMDGHAGVYRQSQVMYDDWNGVDKCWPDGDTRPLSGRWFSTYIPRHLDTTRAEGGLYDLIMLGWDID